MAKKKVKPISDLLKKKKPKIEKEVYTDTLKVELTDKEIRQAADDLAQVLDEMEVVEADSASIAKSFKAKITAGAAKVIQLKNLVRNKYDFRDIKCEKVKNFSKGTLTIKRLDTKRIIMRRKLTGAEKQMGLGLAD